MTAMRSMVLPALLVALIISAPTSVTAQNCQPPMYDDVQAKSAMQWNAKSGPYTYIQTTADMKLSRFGDTFISGFEVEFFRAGQVHLQVWKKLDNNMFQLKHDQLFSAADKGVHNLDNLEWDIDEDDYWGFSYENADEIPIMYVSDSKVTAVSDEKYYGGMEGIEMTKERAFMPSQDAPKTFNIKVCTDRDMGDRMRNSNVRSYTCDRSPSWEDAMSLYPGQLTYINGKKINTPAALLKDFEVQMENANFITIQIWRKDPANFEFLLVREKTFYAKSGYNSLPVNIQMQYGDQWGFSLSSMNGNQILYKNVTSDSSYFFPEFISGAGSKRSYASVVPTPIEFKVSACIEITPQQQASFSQAPSFGQQGQFGTPTMGFQNSLSSYGSPNNAYGPASVINPATQNSVQFPSAYGPSGGAQNVFFPQQSATSCYCTDNTYWYSASEVMNGPYTYINPDPFTEQNGNIEAFEIEAHRTAPVTLQIWRPSGPGMNAMSLVWEKEVLLRSGYQRINLAQTVMSGDRWGFMSTQSGELPIKFYNDESSIGHEFSYQVSAATGQQIFLSSAIVTFKKFKIRPCLCSYMNGMIQLGAGMPYMTYPYTSLDGVASGISAYNGNSGGQQQSNSPTSSQYSNNGGFGLNGNFGMSSATTTSSSSSSNSALQCSGKDISSGQCYDCGNLQVVGPYTHINFMKLPRGRIETIDIVARSSGSIMVQLWRFDSSTQSFKAFWEKPVGLRSYPSMNTVQVNKEVQENDMVGFSYLGTGVVPVQYSTTQGVQSYEDNMGRSTVMGNAEIMIPSSFTSKSFNMKICFVPSSYIGQSSQSLGNYQSQPQNYQSMQFSDAQNGGSPNAYMPNSNQFQQIVSQLSQGMQSMISNIILVLNQGYTPQNINDMQTGSQDDSSQSSEMCSKIFDGEAEGPFENEMTGAYTFIADFQGLGGQCIKSVEFQAHSFESITLIKVKPQMGNFAVVSQKVAVPESIDEPTIVDVDWCVANNEKIGFYYDGPNKVPIRFTYAWGNALEYPTEVPVNGMINTLFETSKSFEMSVHIGELNAEGEIVCPTSGNTQVDQSNTMNSNYGYSNTNQNNYNSYSNNNQNNYNTYPSKYGSGNGNFGGSSFSGNFGYNSQRLYLGPGSPFTPLLDQVATQLDMPSCIGHPIDTRMSLAGFVYSTPGGSYLIPESFQRAGRLSHIELEASRASRISIVHFGVTESGEYGIKNAVNYNLYPGINKISQQYIDWMVDSGDVIGFMTEDQVCPITYIVSMDGQPVFNFNACIEDRVYNSPTTYQYPNQNPGLTQAGSLLSSSTGGSTCSCYDSSHWPFGFEEVYGPYTYINGEDFRQVSGFVQAFEIEAALSGPVTLHIWRKSSPFSDRLTKIWDQNINLQAGYQRINGINANIQDGDLWGFTFNSNGKVPINFLTDTNFFGYEIKDPSSVSMTTSDIIYLSAANVGFKRFKIKPCICSYQTQSNVNQIGQNFNSQLGSVNSNYGTSGSWMNQQPNNYQQQQNSQMTGGNNQQTYGSFNGGYNTQQQQNTQQFNGGSNQQQYGNNNGGYNTQQQQQGSTQFNGGYNQQQYGNTNGGYNTQQQQQQGSTQFNSNLQFNTNGGSNSQYVNPSMIGFAQQASMAPQYPTNAYQYCYGALDKEGYLVKFGPYTHINFEPLPEGVIENIEFDATRPGRIRWLLWRYNQTSSTFGVVYEKEINFQSGKQSAQLMIDTQDRDMIGFYYGDSDEIPIKFSENVGAQSYEDVSPSPPLVGTTILPPNDLEDKLFNYKVCMYSVNNNAPLPTTSNIGGYGYTYSNPTAPYYASGQAFGSVPGFGPTASPTPGYDYNNNYFPSPTYGISQYDPVQAYNYDFYANPSPYSPSYGSSMSYQQPAPNTQQPGTPYGYNMQPMQNQY